MSEEETRLQSSQKPKPATNRSTNNDSQKRTTSQYSTIILALLSSSCCVIQLLLNYLSLGCAGFAILTPYRPILTTLTITFLTYNIYTYGWTRKTFTTALISLLLMSSPEIVASHNTNVLSRSLHSLFGKSVTSSHTPISALFTSPAKEEVTNTSSEQTCTLYQFTVQGMKCEGCASRVKAALDAIPEVHSAEVYFSDKTVTVKVPSSAGIPAITMTKIITSKIAAVDFEYRTNLVNSSDGVACGA